MVSRSSVSSVRRYLGRIPEIFRSFLEKGSFENYSKKCPRPKKNSPGGME
jgi:hypothetical protein